MKRVYLPLCFIILAVPLPAPAQDISEQLKNYLAGKKGRSAFNGTSLVVYKGKILLYEGQGYKDASNKTWNDSATIYRVGSLSKPFTATLILYLRDKGLLTLEDKLAKYIPDFPNAQAISIQNLLSHSSGVKEYLEVKEIRSLPDSAPPVSMVKLISYFKNEPPVINPGQKFRYSNSNYILLAYIAEKVTGDKFEHLIRKIIFDPMGMTHSGFDFKNLNDPKKSTGHILGKNNFIQVTDFDSTYAPGCGSLYTNAMDLYLWYKGLMAGKVITDSTRELSFKPRQWKYGYGWLSYKLYGKRCISHAGGVPGFYANLQFFPDDDLCIILLSIVAPLVLQQTKSHLWFSRYHCRIPGYNIFWVKLLLVGMPR